MQTKTKRGRLARDVTVIAICAVCVGVFHDLVSLLGERVQTALFGGLFPMLTFICLLLCLIVQRLDRLLATLEASRGSERGDDANGP